MGKKDFLQEIREAFSGKKEIKGYAKREAPKAKNFLIIFAAAFIALNILTMLVPLELFELPVANATLWYLNAKGLQGTITAGEPVLITLSSGMQIIISYLCTGLLELIVLEASIIASLGIGIRKRIMGLIMGIVGTQVFNLARIFVTLEFILNTNIQTVEFVHDILFRVTLLFVIVGLYAAWFYWATRSM